VRSNKIFSDCLPSALGDGKICFLGAAGGIACDDDLVRSGSLLEGSCDDIKHGSLFA
jgi:hypothetical protein